MEEKNKKAEPLLIVLITIVILILLSFVPEKAKVGTFAVKPVELFSDIKAE
ncbi:MAG: hypothetical protein WCJ01_01660 [Ignavibacteria bacterium]